jgi:hypothetical protein
MCTFCYEHNSDNGSTTCANETDVREFSSHFGFDHSDMDDFQITTLRHFLYDNKDIFVTKQSPDLGFTDLVQHKIILRPDAKPKYQRPFCTLCLLLSLKGISKCSDVISLKVANVFPLYSSILSLVGFNNFMGTNLSRETICHRILSY